MADNVISAILRLRRDTENNYAVVQNNFIPENGEVCLVDTSTYGLRSKIGDGVHTFAQLNYSDLQTNFIMRGYYFNNTFYIDSTYQTEMEKSFNRIYVNLNSSNHDLYIWDGLEYEPKIIAATDTVAGITKLYNVHGQNTDGTMTQKSITDGVEAIKFAIDQTDPECLVLTIPWD